ncbi:MAG: hypothetical protein AB9869_24090 [Verrucomicrobiia bacterium]
MKHRIGPESEQETRSNSQGEKTWLRPSVLSVVSVRLRLSRLEQKEQTTTNPKLMAMALLAVPVPLIVWLALSKLFASRAGKGIAGGAAGLPVR